ncbi:flagellar hook-associated protein FlgK [Sulfitobacter sp. S0837]|uniref:flagellar hook-associated protein FlgK n=1 Tax=Sulfitobacter maritimus TaxID=2741719 RepID=UPI00158176F2|nr:flagellar hook-associated protein FlgK [Sulfitobacter maritimus]NUH64952.1 flagellar hook-associated protein FlgK [Sulfitobacter maritimus]
MSISSAFNVARSGLSATEGRANLVAGNIAHAQTEGYARRDGAQVSTGGQGSGVELRMVRQMDERLAGLTRNAAAEMGQAQVANEVLGGYLLTLGNPNDEISPAARLAEFQAGLDLLSNNPADPAAQNDLLSRAKTLVQSLNNAANSIEDSRVQAGESYLTSVKETNSALADIAKLNEKLRVAGPDAGAVNSLKDEMNRRLDALGAQMDFTSRWETDGSLTLHTTGGTELVNGDDAVQLTADPDSGALFAGTINITPGATGARGSDSGRLAGLSQIISRDLPQMKLQLDELARGLVQSFEAADMSRGPGDAGLFTDAGAAFDPAQADGLAGRLALNASVDPERGGMLSRLRDGAAATVSREPGDSTQINAFIDVFDSGFAFAPASGLNANATIGDFAADMVGHQNMVRVTADSQAETARIRLVTFEDNRSGVEGVNIDTELQKLMEIEQSYGANSQVLNSLTNMLDTLLSSV